MNEAAKTFLECGDLSPLSKAPTSRRTPKLILPQTPNMRHAGGVRTDAKRRALSLVKTPPARRPPSGRIPRSRPESLPVFDRRDERLDHFGVDEVPVELIQLAQPELISRIAKVRGVRRIATQVSKELSQDK